MERVSFTTVLIVAIRPGSVPISFWPRHGYPAETNLDRHTFSVVPGQEQLKFERRVQSPLMGRQAAWYALAQNARKIAREHDVAPYDLLLGNFRMLPAKVA
jgi:hypothetical protein